MENWGEGACWDQNETGQLETLKGSALGGGEVWGGRSDQADVPTLL